ncbi:MAG: hypothetical protein H0T75_16685 [Rhizobiales bacterium]|nr:hypothetical protein [Hyphomicrobiales bacterium]
MAELRLPVRRSPLGHRAPIEAEAGAVRMAERPFLGKFILRADRHEAVEPLRSVLGLGLPFDPMTSSAAGDTALLWMGPDEWMLVTAPGAASELHAKAKAALAGAHHQLVDASDYHTVIEVAGVKARELLMKLTTLDLHPRAFPAGMATGSVFGKANATIWLPMERADDNGLAFQLFIRWSMADYFWCLLANAGREWGIPEQAAVKGEALTIA